MATALLRVALAVALTVALAALAALTALAGLDARLERLLEGTGRERHLLRNRDLTRGERDFTAGHDDVLRLTATHAAAAPVAEPRARRSRAALGARLLELVATARARPRLATAALDLAATARLGVARLARPALLAGFENIDVTSLDRNFLVRHLLVGSDHRSTKGPNGSDGPTDLASTFGPYVSKSTNAK